MNECTHETSYWKVISYIDDWDGETHTKQERVTKSYLVDIDLHRMKCTQCGMIEYYSGAARAYYEDGNKTHIDILFKK